MRRGRLLSYIFGLRGGRGGAGMPGRLMLGPLGVPRSTLASLSGVLLLKAATSGDAVLAPVALLFLAIALLLPRIVTAAIASGIDGETPSLILYLLPYAWSPYSAADLIARIAHEARGFRWMRLEARRLSTYLEWGMDPLSALQRLARTTPSHTLRETLEEIIHAARLGFPRSLLLTRLAERALERVRSKWHSYSEAAKTAAEANAAIIVAIGVMAPLASVTGGPKAALLPVSVLAPSLAALALVLLQPSSGPGSTPLPARLLPLAVGYAASGVALAGHWLGSMILLAPAAAAVEAYGMLYMKRLTRSLRLLGEAARKARLGKLDENELLKASHLDKPVIEAVARALRIAGGSGIWQGLEALESSYRSALTAIKSTRGQAVMSAAVTLVAIAVSWYALGLIDSIAGQAGPTTLYALPAIEVATFMRAAAIAAGLTPGVLLRPRIPSLFPSLLMLAAVEALSMAGVGIQAGLRPLE